MKNKTFNFKFAIDDRVWCIDKRQQQIKIECKTCGGVGKINLLTNETFSCPKCYGKGHHIEWKDEKWCLRDERVLTIGLQRVEIRFDNIKECYMCHETGIGSGSVYDCDKLYSSKTEALDECKKRNINEKLDAILEK